MGDPKGFLRVNRRSCSYRPVNERLQDYCDVVVERTAEEARSQASRCMDCGTPFCHMGCPLGNLIPDWNDNSYRGQWQKAYKDLSSTNNFPEFTGRICPAPCEYACVLGINDDPVTIRENELSIIEFAYKAGYVRPSPPKKRSGKKVAVIGSGPSGLAAADQLNKAGHRVTVFERDTKAGGLLRYGIPDFKLEKKFIDRRLSVMKKEGVAFKTGVHVGPGDIEKLKKDFDAVVIAVGSRNPRDLAIEGRELSGIHFAMEYLTISNRNVSGEKHGLEQINAKGRKVVVIGGGDTGSDCVGTANRQGASSVVQIEVMPQPPVCRTADMPWPKYPMLFKTTSSHEEGAKRDFSVLTKKFSGEDGSVKKLHCVKVEFVYDPAKGCKVMKEVPGTEFEIEADLVFLALGFLGPEKAMTADQGLKTDGRSNLLAENYMTSKKGVFACGDCRRGQSLVVWAIYEGREAAKAVDEYLKVL